MGKRLQKIVVFIALTSLATFSYAEESGQCKEWVAKAAAVVGNVDAKRDGQADWTPVKRNDTYCPGDQIRAARASSATLVFTNETLVTLDQLTAITINKIDNDGPSLIELIKGIAHFISRVPRSLKVETPFVNAAIEGTEFVVEVGDTETNVTVFEGTVLTANDQGELRVTNNETSKTRQGEAPQKILLARPRDAVQWALYFPPIIKSDNEGSNLEQASALLYSGLANEAKALIRDDQSGEAKALLAIIAIVNNQDNALELASEAIKRSPDTAASHIALSYAWQSRFDLNQAMTSATTATEKEPNNAIAWARLAELQLSVGRLSRALESATRASEIDPSLARTQTILGFAYLTRIQITRAKETFDKAIELDQSDPLPHLGLGLAMIRRNDLAEGRREIEIAAALDPNNSIIRSYLGKAYFEEKRAPLDAEQFAMAKELDPNDPTPHLYNAIRRQTENDPVGALKDINKSIELNDNRAVFRSSLQLDQDEATRSASLAAIYVDIGAEQTAIVETSKSLSTDPTNYSAHKNLSNLYLTRPRHNIAVASENLQSKLFQPINLIPIKPQSDKQNIFIQEAISTGDANDRYDSSLYTRDGTNFLINGTIGSNNLLSDNIIVYGLSNSLSYSLGQYYFQTDGYRENNDLKQKNYNIFLQKEFTPKLNMQLELTSGKRENGDLRYLFDLDDFNLNQREIFDENAARLGINYKANESNNLILSLIRNNIDYSFNNVSDLAPGIELTLSSEQPSDGNNVELGHIYHYNNDIKFVSGLGYNSTETDITTRDTLRIGGNIVTDDILNSQEDIQHSNAYIYSYINAIEKFDFTLGLSYDNYNQTNGAAIIDKEQFNPKFGLIWSPINGTAVRIAAFKTLKRSLVNNTTIETTNIAGFNQFFDDASGSEAKNYALGIDQRISKTLIGGFEYNNRDIVSPSVDNANTGAVSQEQLNEESGRLFLTWVITDHLVLSGSAIYDDFERESIAPSAVRPKSLKTFQVPISAKYFFSSGLIFGIKTTYLKQQIQQSTTTSDEDSVWLTDIDLSYKLPNRLGIISVEALNISDQQFNYYNPDFGTGTIPIQTYTPERTLLFRISIEL